MRSSLIILFSNLLFISTYAQKSANAYNNELHVSFSKSKNGTGDVNGILFSSGLTGKLSNKFNWQADLSGSIHNGSYPLFYQAPSGETIDGSYRYTIAGLQASYLVTRNFIKNSRSGLELKAGGLIRYQSSSYYDIITVYYPIITGLPVPVTVIENSNPARTFAVGGMMQLGYGYSYSKNSRLEIFGAFQADTNGDNLSQLGLSYYRKIAF